MKKRVQGLVAGLIIGATVAGTGAFAYTNYIEAVYGDIKIVVDGKKVNPDSKPFISEGTTYLPVRAVAEALDKPVYWDGETSTVYIGKYSGSLEYPSVKLSELNNIGDAWNDKNKLKDNYGNYYSDALCYAIYWSDNDNRTAEYILNGKYSRIKGTIYVPEGEKSDKSCGYVITADGKDIYTSPEMTKTSKPVDFDVSIKGCNDLKIRRTGGGFMLHLGNVGLYQ